MSLTVKPTQTHRRSPMRGQLHYHYFRMSWS
jgi:hypothetical protein